MMEDPQNPYNQSPSDKDPSQQPTSGSQEQKIEELVNQALERKQTTQYLDQLRNRVNWLTGLFAVAVIILGGGLAWVSYSLQQQRQQFVQQNEELESPENLERMEELEAEIQQLQEQVPDIQRIERLEQLQEQVLDPQRIERLEQLQEQTLDPQRIERLEDQIDQLNVAIENNQQQLERILRENQTQGLQEDSPE